MAAVPVEQLLVGNILDAQDYLGAWHLAIVIDAKGAARQIHFLPFSKANRDEEFTADDSQRVARVFSMTKAPADKEIKTQFNTLKTYMDAARAKLGKKPEEFKQPPPAQSLAPASRQFLPQGAAAGQSPDAAVRAQKAKRTQKGAPPGGKLGLGAAGAEGSAKSESAED